MDRRKFLKTSGALCGMGLVGSALLVESCKKSSNTSAAQGPTVNVTLDLSQSTNSALKSIGQGACQPFTFFVCVALLNFPYSSRPWMK